MTMEAGPKLSADQWLATPEFSYLEIYDPDGWRRDAPGRKLEWETPITRAEFQHRLMYSTIIPKRPWK
jgi:hypothetical protein